MKNLVLLIATCLALTSSMLHAASKDTAAAQSAPKSQSADTAAFDKNVAQFQEQIKTMHAQMDAIRQTQDPQERQKLLQQHWATMQSAMATMRGMWGPGTAGPGRMGHGMMGPGMMGGGWGHMGGYYSSLSPEQHDVAAAIPDPTPCISAVSYEGGVDRILRSRTSSMRWR
jgi:hypothetical protein